MKLQIGCYDLSFFKYLQKIVIILGTGHYLPGREGYFFFEKWLKKKHDPPLQHDKKIMTLPQRRLKKIVTLLLSLFLFSSNFL